ncbi:MarR family transcriptional regulator [Altererythrobacter soli]|uniref:MarR family transcriptional regulator n=1 Tax=Croceibacterium soli TaxID=1739690 RepID=A0A6I4UYC2_9SPHN|nr:MarR family transcriptional regulator [Croceibacterium soli]MXP42583.1 MarR family transcriptional regulator [Croceibacterium soli]
MNSGENYDHDDWSTRYNEFYPAGSRLDNEFRTSLMLVRSGKSWTQRVESRILNETGQTRARWQVLFAIGFAEQPVIMSELCKRVHVQWPTMVRLIEAMERDGLIRREDHPDDKRSRYIYLTAAGEDVIARVQPVLDNERSAVFGALSDAELKTAQAILEKIYRASTT